VPKVNDPVAYIVSPDPIVALACSKLAHAQCNPVPDPG
jgi:hypothetical protein